MLDWFYMINNIFLFTVLARKQTNIPIFMKIYYLTYK